METNKQNTVNFDHHRSMVSSKIQCGSTKQTALFLYMHKSQPPATLFIQRGIATTSSACEAKEILQLHCTAQPLDLLNATKIRPLLWLALVAAMAHKVHHLLNQVIETHIHIVQSTRQHAATRERERLSREILNSQQIHNSGPRFIYVLRGASSDNCARYY